MSRNWTTAHFLTFYGWPWNCHCIGECVIQLMYYSEHILRLKLCWKSNLLVSWTQLVLISFCHVLWLCHSFKWCDLPFFPPVSQQSFINGKITVFFYFKLRLVVLVVVQLNFFKDLCTYLIPISFRCQQPPLQFFSQEGFVNIIL